VRLPERFLKIQNIKVRKAADNFGFSNDTYLAVLAAFKRI